jgi:hypothetical protein
MYYAFEFLHCYVSASCMVLSLQQQYNIHEQLHLHLWRFDFSTNFYWFSCFYCSCLLYRFCERVLGHCLCREGPFSSAVPAVPLLSTWLWSICGRKLKKNSERVEVTCCVFVDFTASDWLTQRDYVAQILWSIELRNELNICSVPVSKSGVSKGPN